MLSGFLRSYAPTRSSFALSDILRIAPPRKGAADHYETCTVYLASGKEIQIARSEADDIMARAIHVIPAEPHTNALHFDLEGGGIFRTPIIAWALCADGELRLITPTGMNDGMDDESVERGPYAELPDGRVCGVGQFVEPSSADSAGEMLSKLQQIRENELAYEAKMRTEREAK